VRLRVALVDEGGRLAWPLLWVDGSSGATGDQIGRFGANKIASLRLKLVLEARRQRWVW